MQYENRQTLLKHLLHIFQNSNCEESIRFQVNIIDFLCSNTNEVKQFALNPSNYLKQLHFFLTEGVTKFSKDQKQFQSFIKNHKTIIILKSIPFVKGLYCKINQLTSDDVGKWVAVAGTVIQSIQTKTLQKSKDFACNDCGAKYRRQNNYQNFYRFQMPGPCTNIVEKEKSNNLFTTFYKNLNKRKQKKDQKEDAGSKMAKCGCTKFSPVQQKKICIDYQQLRIQQQFKHISAGRLPQTVTVIIQGAIGQNWRPGDDVIVSGILNYRYKKPSIDQKMQMQMIIVANTLNLQKSNISKDNFDRESMYQQSQYSEFPFSFLEEDNQLSKEMILAKQLEYRNSVVKKFCPTIFGRQIVKLGLILSLLGGVSIQNQHTKIRGQSHVLLIGQPGTGKSVLIKQAANLAERSFFTNGIGTSSAGLSVSYYKDGTDWTIEPGALVLADNGVCCIDQLTLLSKKDQNSLLQAMEQQTVCSAKASVVGKLNARTTVIGACNPITPTQKYDTSVDLQVNTGLSIPLLTRFDLILILKDQNERAEDSVKCDYILDKFTGEEHHYEHKQQFPLKPLLKRCKLFQPQLRGAQFLSQFYIQQRKNTQKVTTARAFESLCRLTEAHAKLMMRDYTTEFDCLSAIMMTEGVYVSSVEEYSAYLSYFHQKYHISMN